MGLSNLSSEGILGTSRAVVVSLRCGKTCFGPSEGSLGNVNVGVKKVVFLFNSEPRLFMFRFSYDL